MGKGLKTSPLLLVLLINLLGLLLVAIPIPNNPLIPEAHASAVGLSYNPDTNIVLYNRNTSDSPVGLGLFNDWYFTDIISELNLLDKLNMSRCELYNASITTWTDQSTAINDATFNDTYLVPNNPVTVGDEVYFGAEVKFSKLKLNMSTAGVYTSTITWQYYRSSGWTTLIVGQNPNPVFKSTGMGTISFTPNTFWTTTTVNGLSRYWIRARITTAGTVTTQPKCSQVWFYYQRKYQVRPAEENELKLDIVVTNYASAGVIGIQGADFDGSPISDKITVTSATTYTTTKHYNSIGSATDFYINCTGAFTFQIHQNRWGSIALSFYGYYGYATNFIMLSALQIGDGSHIIQAWDTLKVIYISIYPNPSTYMIRVKNNASLIFGTLVDLNNKGVKEGLQIYSEGSNVILGDAGSTVYLYSFSMVTTDYTQGKISFYGNSRTWGLSGNVEVHGFNLDVDNVFFLGCNTPFNIGTETINGSFTRMTFFSASILVSTNRYSDSDFTLENLFARNYTWIYYNMPLGINPDHDTYFVNPDVDSWHMQIGSGITSKVYEQYDLELHTDVGATVTIWKKTTPETEIVSETVGSNGTLTQLLTRRFFNQTGLETNPYEDVGFRMEISKTGYQTYNSDFNITKKSDWEIYLQTSTGTGGSAGGGFFFAMIIGLFVGVPMIAVIVIMTKR